MNDDYDPHTECRATADRLRSRLHAIYNRSALESVASDLDEDNHATAAQFVRDAIVAMDRMAKALLENEWKGEYSSNGRGRTCPECEVVMVGGPPDHDPNCSLGKLCDELRAISGMT